MSALASGARLDPRLRLVMLFLVPGFVGHTIQLTAEDVPWDGGAWERYWWTPGWHLFVEPWVIVAIAVMLGLAVLGLVPRIGAATATGPRRRRQVAQSSANKDLIAHNQPMSGVAENLRTIRTNLSFMGADGGQRGAAEEHHDRHGGG